jgi:hypothetical protein
MSDTKEYGKFRCFLPAERALGRMEMGMGNGTRTHREEIPEQREVLSSLEFCSGQKALTRVVVLAILVGQKTLILEGRMCEPQRIFRVQLCSFCLQ